jgi:ABC-type glycerol-3-phosphate transport system permease component
LWREAGAYVGFTYPVQLILLIDTYRTMPFLYMPSSDLGVISTALFRFTGPFGAHWEISAGVILVIVPTLVLFVLLQRFIYNGFTSGATK